LADATNTKLTLEMIGRVGYINSKLNMYSDHFGEILQKWQKRSGGVSILFKRRH
jgi:hypothetical protein